MATPSEFYEKLRALRPGETLKPGFIFVAILHYDKSPDHTFDQPDALWIKCPKEKDVTSLVKAYRNACPEAGEFVLRHNFQVLEETTKISALANRYPNNFVALDAVRTKDLDKRKTPTSTRPALADVTNNAISRPSSKLHASETPSKDSQSTPSTSHRCQLPQESNTLVQSKVQCLPTQTPSTYSQLVPPSNTDNGSKETGWIDFLIERLESSRQAVNRRFVPPKQTAKSSEQDQEFRGEWLQLQDGQRSYFVDRGQKIEAAIRLTRAEGIRTDHWAFWCFYYDSYFQRPVTSVDPHCDFQYRKRNIEEFLENWKRMDLNTRKLWSDHVWTFATDAINRGAFDYPQLTPRQTEACHSAEKQAVETTTLKQESPPSQPEESEVPQFDQAAVEADFHVDLEDVPGTQAAAPVRLSMSELFDGRAPEQLEKSVEEGGKLLNSIQETLEQQPGQDASQWLQAVTNVQKQAIRSKTVIGVVGATGAGKSSVINAMLDEERLVPTNCMRACTAVVTEISYNFEDDEPYKAVVEFISREDWHKMLKVLFQDLFDGSGQVSRECSNEDSESGIAYAQIKAVYPKLTKEDMEHTTIEKLMEHSNVACLGTSRDITSDDSIEFYKQLQRYVDSKEKSGGKKEKGDKEKKKPREMEYWPLIRVVRIHIKAPALATGAVIVDLPGVHDSNQARAAVAQSYMKQCTGLWIVAPITRAVDDKSAKNLLGDTFKRQLKMDGGFNSVTFICSKTDDISITEAQDSLGLDDELAPMWEKSGEFSKQKHSIRSQIEDLRETKSDVENAMETVDEETDLWEKLQEDYNDGKTVFAPKSKSHKRKRADDASPSKKKKRPNYRDPDSDDDEFIDDRDDGDDAESDAGSDYASSNASEDQGAPLSEDNILMKLAHLRGTRKDGRREKARIDEQIQELNKQIRKIEKESQGIDDKLSAKCISGRNDYSRDAIRQDYAAGIRELDQEIAEEEDAANFDPEIDRRDYDEVAENLPVFCVSSRAYQKLKGRLQKDKMPPGFTHVDETEVPALQAHCIHLTTAARQAQSRKFLTSMFQLLNSLRLWAANDGSGRNLTEGQFKREAQILKEKLTKLDAALEKAVTAIVEGLADELQHKVYEAYPAATSAAAAEAEPTAQRWGLPVDHENRAAGGLHWATYKAVVRRDGSFTGSKGTNNFNEQLIEPLIRHLAGPWESVFARRMPGILNSLPGNAGHILTTFHNEVESRAVRNGASIAAFQMLKHQISVYKETLKDAMTEARGLITEKQRNINREFEPTILEHMLPVYEMCAAESGRGSFQRMKGNMRSHIEDKKATMFEDAVGHIRDLVKGMLKEVKEILLVKVDAVFEAVDRDYTGVIVGKDHGKKKEVFPRDQRMTRKAILGFIESAEMILKKAVGLEADIPLAAGAGLNPSAVPDGPIEIPVNIGETLKGKSGIKSEVMSEVMPGAESEIQSEVKSEIKAEPSQQSDAVMVEAAPVSASDSSRESSESCYSSANDDIPFSP